MEILINPKISLENWKDFVQNHPQGQIFHLPVWQEILEKSFGYKPYNIFATDKGKICGLLLLLEVRSFLTGNRLVSLPKSNFVDILANSEDIEKELILKAKKLLTKTGSRYLEIRGSQDKNYLSKTENYSTFYLTLEKDIQDTWQKLHRTSVRSPIRKAKREGVVIIKGNSKEILKEFYLVNLINKRNMGVPAHSWSFLKNFHQELKNNLEIYVAKINGEVAAAVINVFYKDTVICLYGGADKKFLKFRPNNLVFWQTIEDFSKKGFKYFDFGRSFRKDLESVNFKKRWGTVEKKLYYYYYPNEVDKFERDKKSYHLITKIWQKLPLPVAAYLGNKLSKHFD